LDTNLSPPTVSVITVVRNGRDAILATMESVFSQSYSNIEYLVIDGASTDGTQEIVSPYADRIDVWLSEQDGGVYAAMNKAVGLATGEFIVFMNCGDVFADDDALSSAMACLAPTGDQVLFGCWKRRLAGGALLDCNPRLAQGIFNHQAVIYSRNIHAWHGGYADVSGLTAADYLFFATLFDSSAVACKVTDTVIAIINVNGISAGPQTLSQKTAIDFICGRSSRSRLLLVLLLHPAYRWLKVFMRRRS